MEFAKDKYIGMDIEYEKVHKRKKQGILNWINSNRLFSTVIVLTLTFSIINIILIMKFFTILANL